MPTSPSQSTEPQATHRAADAAGAAKPRTKRRKPPVIERSGVTARSAPGPAQQSTDPPQVTVPAVPSGFTPANPLDLRGYHPLASQIAALPDAIDELQGFADYTARFGTTAPNLGELRRRLDAAAEWTALFAQTTTWYHYVRSQYGTVWKDALDLLDGLKAPFELAARADPVLLAQYPAVANLLEATRINAKRAVAARARNKAAKDTPPVT